MVSIRRRRRAETGWHGYDLMLDVVAEWWVDEKHLASSLSYS